jgi:NTE family protein
MSHSGVALCLNSSFLGYYAHAGFLEACTQLGLRPAAVSGASAGGFVAGLYAGGLSPEQIVAFTLSPELKRAYFDWRAPGRGMQMLLNRRGFIGLFSADKALALMRRVTGDRRIEDCDPRLAIAVTDLTTGQAVTATSGPIAEMIVATCAFPMIFQARTVEGRKYWDGGIANPVPFGHWADDAAIHTILIHLVSHHGESVVRSGRRELNVFDAVNLSHQIICDELIRAHSARAEAAGKRVIFFRTLTPKPSLSRPKTWPTFVEAGRQTVREHSSVLSGFMA